MNKRLFDTLDNILYKLNLPLTMKYLKRDKRGLVKNSNKVPYLVIVKDYNTEPIQKALLDSDIEVMRQLDSRDLTLLINALKFEHLDSKYRNYYQKRIEQAKEMLRGRGENLEALTIKYREYLIGRFNRDFRTGFYINCSVDEALKITADSIQKTSIGRYADLSIHNLLSTDTFCFAVTVLKRMRSSIKCVPAKNIDGSIHMSRLNTRGHMPGFYFKLNSVWISDGVSLAWSSNSGRLPLLNRYIAKLSKLTKEHLPNAVVTTDGIYVPTVIVQIIR